MDALQPPIRREELLAGFVGRRASTAAFAIEARTAFLALQATHASAPAICDGMIETQERALLAAFAGGRRLDRAPTIQQIERHADGWRHLVPKDVDGRAGVARRLAASHRFRARDVPRLRAVLGLGDPAVAAALQARFGQQPSTLYAESLPVADHVRWLGARIATRFAELPPLWTAFALTLTQTVGAGILALPIAFAGVGPIAGLGVLVVLGVLNVLTASAVAETFSRTGTVRWGGAFFGRVVTHYLGRSVGLLVSGALVALSVLVVGAYYIGLGTSLASATGAPAALWAAALFVVVLAGAGRGRVGGTLASALVVGFVNLTLIVAVSVLALPHLDVGRLGAVDLSLTGPQVLGPVFGVGIMAFFGHTAVASGAREVLRREPDGRALIRGTALAMVTAIVLYGLWVIVIGGAVPHESLIGVSGTALEPLAEVAGSVVLVPGTAFAVLSMGMGAVLFSLGLHHQATEWVPATGRWSRVAGVLPLVGIFVVVEVLLLTGRESFTGALSLVGVLTAPLLAGVVPVLLLAAARRRGEYVPQAQVPLLLRPAVLAVVLAVFLGALVAHGTVLWTGVLPRAAAMVTAIVLAVVCVRVLRSGAFRPVTSIELRRDAELGGYRLRVTSAGRRADVHVRVEPATGEEHRRRLAGALALPADARSVVVPVDAFAHAIHLWTHEVDAVGTSVPLAVDAGLVNGGHTRPIILSDGHADIAEPGEALRLVLPTAGRR